MKTKLLFASSALGLWLGSGAAYFFGLKKEPLPPAFRPASNPYAAGIYAEGMVESDQPNGMNINMYPEVNGTVAKIPVREGQEVRQGQVLIQLDLSIPAAQVELARANLKTAQDQFTKLRDSYLAAPGSVAKSDFDNALNAVLVASATLDVQAATLSKFTLRAPSDGVVLSINAAVGGYVSPQGSYDTYTQGFDPILSMGATQAHLNVRCYVDEILVPKIPPLDKMKARLFIRGTETEIPLHYIRMQPFVSPKIELSDAKQERVDVRVLPIIFKVDNARHVKLYTGQLVDVYLGQ